MTTLCDLQSVGNLMAAMRRQKMQIHGERSRRWESNEGFLCLEKEFSSSGACPALRGWIEPLCLSWGPRWEEPGTGCDSSWEWSWMKQHKSLQEPGGNLLHPGCIKTFQRNPFRLDSSPWSCGTQMPVQDEGECPGCRLLARGCSK